MLLALVQQLKHIAQQILHVVRLQLRVTLAVPAPI